MWKNLPPQTSDKAHRCTWCADVHVWLAPEMAGVGALPTAPAGSCSLLLTVQRDSNQKNQIKLSGPFPVHPMSAFLLFSSSRMARKPYGSRNGQHSHWLPVPSNQPLLGFLLWIKSLRKFWKKDIIMCTPFAHSHRFMSPLGQQHKRGVLIHFTLLHFII